VGKWTERRECLGISSVWTDMRPLACAKQNGLTAKKAWPACPMIAAPGIPNVGRGSLHLFCFPIQAAATFHHWAAPLPLRWRCDQLRPRRIGTFGTIFAYDQALLAYSMPVLATAAVDIAFALFGHSGALVSLRRASPSVLPVHLLVPGPLSAGSEPDLPIYIPRTPDVATSNGAPRSFKPPQNPRWAAAADQADFRSMNRYAHLHSDC